MSPDAAPAAREDAGACRGGGGAEVGEDEDDEIVRKAADAVAAGTHRIDLGSRCKHK